nr:MAG TPA: hypothetical protein [Caudoviricetes sp.]
MVQLTPRLAYGYLAPVWYQLGAALYPICEAMKMRRSSASNQPPGCNAW